MSSATLAPRVPVSVVGSTLPTLARREIRRYALHPLFLLGLGVNILVCLQGPEERTSTVFLTLVPAAAIGVFGIVIMASLTRSSETLRTAAGVVPVTERTRTMALASACLVPFAAGLVWWAWAVATYSNNPPTPNGFPFGPVSDGWVAAVMFGQAPIACIGGPLLGLVVARWIGGRAAPAITAVAVVAACIVMQGIFEPLRRIRVVMPWTHWGGPLGIEGDPERMVIYPGSPYWWIAYLACLCVLGLLAALLHDREQPRRRLLLGAVAVGCVALVTVLLASVTGIPDMLVNPLPS
jgi:hypothetical protein